MNLPRFLRTVRQLKPVQVYGRLIYRAHRPRPRLEPAPALRRFPGSWVAPIRREPSLIGPNQVRLLNEEGRFDAASGWNDPARAKLWLYNLHYFDELAAEADAARTSWRRAMVEQWIAENPPGAGVGWDAYPVSLRIVNWIKWAMGGMALEPAWRHSLAVQTRWLHNRIEWHLQGNHLLANAKALIFAGLYFEGAQAERWLAWGLDLHQRQLAEQILADGGHAERSPMYHAILLEDLLDLVNLARVSGDLDAGLVAGWIDLAERLRAWLAVMVHPDGQLGFFSDAAFGVAATPDALDGYAHRLGLSPPTRAAGRNEFGATWLAASGYVRMVADQAVVLLDVTPAGPNHLLGHAHADTLSFEFSVGCERIVVNGGVSVYGDGPQRQLERSTAAHSTVEVDGCDSSEVWGGFRVGRRAKAFDVEVREEGATVLVSAAHGGYGRRPGRPIHRRSWRLQAGGVTITDRIEGGATSALARFHLQPDIRCCADGDGRTGQLVTPSGRIIRWKSSQPARLEPSQWRPQFGMRLDTRQLVASAGGEPLQTEFSW